MGFQIAELFVDISLRGATFTAGLSAVKASLERFGASLEKIGAMAEKFLLVSAGIAAYSLKEWIHAEKGLREFEAALTIVGKTYKEVGKDEEEFFDKIEKAYVIMNDEVRDLATQAIKLGAAFEDVNNIVELGIGLGDRYFGGDSAAGVRALTLAQHGQLRSLQLLIPEIRHASSLQEALTIIQTKATEGLEFSKARTESLEGSLRRLHVAVQHLGEGFGKLLAPQLMAIGSFIQRATIMIDKMSDSEKMFVITNIEVGAAIAGVLVILPKVISTFNILFHAISSLTGVVLSVGKAFFALVTGPLGGFIIALGLVAAAVVVLAGTGDTFAERFSSGFASILDTANVFLGGWQQFSILMSTIADDTSFRFVNAWEIAKASFLDILIEIENATKMTFELLGKFAEVTWRTIKGEDPKNMNGPEVLGEIMDRYNKDTHNREAANHAALERDRKANEKAQELLTDENQKKLQGLPKLSDQIKGMVDEIKQKSGMEGFVKQLQDLATKFNNINLTPGAMPEIAGSIAPSEGAKAPKPTYQSLGDAFKDSLASILFGEKAKAESLAAKHLKEAEKTNDKLDQANVNLENLAVLGTMV